MNTEISFLLNTIQKELWLHWRLALISFVITAMLFLTAAMLWPKIFTSSSVVLVDQQSILSPLMQGTAVTTSAINRSKVAQQTIFTQKSMNQIIRSEYWAGDAELNAREFDVLTSALKDNAEVSDKGQNLIEISFSDKDPIKAYETAKLLTQIFLEESIKAKREESGNAFSFIDEQVSIYQNKLKLAEKAIKDFRAENVNATEGVKDNVNERMVEIKREQENIELEILTEEQNILNNNKRLSGEISAEFDASFERESELQLRIEELTKRLAELRLNYMDTYPDIIQLKSQIDSLREKLIAESSKRESFNNTGKRTLPTGTIAQDLKRSIQISDAKIITARAKLDQLKMLMARERETLTQINAVEEEVAELNRDYNVNQTMYKDLLSQRENARVSMNMDIKNQGLTMKVQDPAMVPVKAQGLRFGHIVLAGLLFSFLVPIGLVFGLTMIDQKARNESHLRDELRLPILAAVYNTKTVLESRRDMMKLAVIGCVILTIWSVYGYAILQRIQG